MNEAQRGYAAHMQGPPLSHNNPSEALNAAMAVRDWTPSPPDDGPQLGYLEQRLSATFGEFQRSVVMLNDIADALYGPRPPQPDPATVEPTGGNGRIGSLNQEAAALAWISDRLADAISRFSHLV